MGLNAFKVLSRRLRRDALTNSIIVLVLIILVILLFMPHNNHNNHLKHYLDVFGGWNGGDSDGSREAKQASDGIRWPGEIIMEKLANLTYPQYIENIIGNYEEKKRRYVGDRREGDGGAKFDASKLSEKEAAAASESVAEYAMNIFASDRIPMNRVMPDLRHPECRNWHYAENGLPTASVVIVFHNEGFSTLMRTVHSVLLRSPRKFLHEIILLDDFSDKPMLGEHLERYIETNFGQFRERSKSNYSQNDSGDRSDETEYSDDDDDDEDDPDDPRTRMLRGEKRIDAKSGKVRLIRNSRRTGLIRSRTRGASEATGEVVVFLDAHCEVGYNWLAPLLAPIAVDRRTMTVPIIDGIDARNFAIHSVYDVNRRFAGIWEWGMLYKEIEIERTSQSGGRFTEPYESPTHAGGLFAIWREFFFELGAYDPGLRVWGGENFELSFKVWQCGNGGRLLWVPCSRVAHVYRLFMPYNFGTLEEEEDDEQSQSQSPQKQLQQQQQQSQPQQKRNKGAPLIIVNYKRVVEVWFDERYKQYFYTREPMAKYYDAGDIGKQLRLKINLECKPFDWFMRRHAAIVLRDFPLPPPNVVWGLVRTNRSQIDEDDGEDHNHRCLEARGLQPPSEITLAACRHDGSGYQVFRLNANGQFGFGERCIEPTEGGRTIRVTYCKLGTVDGPWRYERRTRRIVYRGRLCLAAERKRSTSIVTLFPCDNRANAIIADRPELQWSWHEIREIS